jgi:hypothetical protein
MHSVFADFPLWHAPCVDGSWINDADSCVDQESKQKVLAHQNENIAHDQTQAGPTHKRSAADSASIKRAVWEVFRDDHALLRRHNVLPHELEALSRVAMLGSVRTKGDLIFMLNAIRRGSRR